MIVRSGSAVTLPCNTPLINSRWFATCAVLSSALGFLLRRSIGCQYVDVSSGPVFVVIACDVAMRIDCEDLLVVFNDKLDSMILVIWEYSTDKLSLICNGCSAE